MQPIQEKILLYFELPVEEQAKLDLQIQGDSELEALFAESQALHLLLNSEGQDTIPDVSALLDYVLFSGDQGGKVPADVVARYARTESAFREDPALKAKVDAMRETILRLTEAAEDPIARFERLRQPRSKPSTVDSTDRSAIAGRRGMKLFRPLRLALAACVGLVAVYGILLFVSWQSQSEQSTLAGLSNATAAFDELYFRGPAEPPHSSDLEEALTSLREARSTTLGLFPVYDDERLEAAAALAQRAATMGDQNSLDADRAYYILGKIRLHQGLNEEAAQALQVVVDHQAEGAADARRLLDYIRR